LKEKAMKARMVGPLVLAVAGILLSGMAAGAQGFGGGPGGPGGPGAGGQRPPFERAFGAMSAQKGWWNNPRMVERLKLTDAQRKSMDDIMMAHREKLIDLKANLEKAELAMQPLMSADEPNDAATIAQIDKVVAARGELERANARFLLAIREKLTPDQWKQVKSFREEGGMRGGMRDGGRDGQRWGRGGQRPGMNGGPGGQGGPGMNGPNGQQFRHHGPPPPAGTPPTTPQGAPAPGTGTGEQQ
jgi:Spy/CpxP family protein refolding chaperone